MSQNIPWKKFDHPTPYSVVAGFAVDPKGNIVLLHRSNEVRSARNVWSVPSGLHEIGVPKNVEFARELKEELNLDAIDPMLSIELPGYENIGTAADPWHWVIAMIVMPVMTFNTLVNKEPDKHDEIAVISLHDLLVPHLFVTKYRVHSSAIEWYEKYAATTLFNAVLTVIKL